MVCINIAFRTGVLLHDLPIPDKVCHHFITSVAFDGISLGDINCSKTIKKLLDFCYCLHSGNVSVYISSAYYLGVSQFSDRMYHSLYSHYFMWLSLLTLMLLETFARTHILIPFRNWIYCCRCNCDVFKIKYLEAIGEKEGKHTIVPALIIFGIFNLFWTFDKVFFLFFFLNYKF